jgi:hypothetical protein
MSKLRLPLKRQQFLMFRPKKSVSSQLKPKRHSKKLFQLCKQHRKPFSILKLHPSLRLKLLHHLLRSFKMSVQSLISFIQKLALNPTGPR